MDLPSGSVRLHRALPSPAPGEAIGGGKAQVGKQAVGASKQRFLIACNRLLVSPQHQIGIAHVVQKPGRKHRIQAYRLFIDPEGLFASACVAKTHAQGAVTFNRAGAEGERLSPLVDGLLMPAFQQEDMA